MKNIVLLCMAVALCIGTNLYATDGDLTVTGNVGIGTTSPTAQLSIVSPVTWTPLTGTVDITHGGMVVTGEGNTLFLTELKSGNIVMFGSDTAVYTVNTVYDNENFSLPSPYYAGANATGVTVYRADKATAFTISDTLNSTNLTVTNGLVGIGTATPQAKLDVAGSLKAGSLQTGNITATSTITTRSQTTKGSITFGSTVPGTSRANKLLCWTSTGVIGYCSSTSVTGVSCTCTSIY